MVENAICRIFRKGARRVVIPGFGTLVKRDSGEIVFTDMLRTDDGMLTSAVVGMFGISEGKAKSIIDNYASSLLKEISQDGKAIISGIGSVVRSPSGLYTFIPEREHTGNDTEDQPAVPQQHETGEGMNPVTTLITGEQTTGLTACGVSPEEEITQIFSASDETAAPLQKAGGISIGKEDETTGADTVTEPEAGTGTKPEHKVITEAGTGQGQEQEVRTETRAGTGTEPAAESDTDITEIPGLHRQQQDKTRIRSALYGEHTMDETGEAYPESHGTETVGTRPATGKSYAARSGSRNDNIAGEAGGSGIGSHQTGNPEAEYRPHINIRRSAKPRKRIDAVMIVAIIALLITAGVLVYGYISKRDMNTTGEYELVTVPDQTGEQQQDQSE